MNARVELPPAREVCPTTTHRVPSEGALLVDVRELAAVAQLAVDAPGVLLMPMSELAQRFAEAFRSRDPSRPTQRLLRLAAVRPHRRRGHRSFAALPALAAAGWVEQGLGLVG